MKKNQHTLKTTVALAAIVFLLGSHAVLADNNEQGGDSEEQGRMEHRGFLHGFFGLFNKGDDEQDHEMEHHDEQDHEDMQSDENDDDQGDDQGDVNPAVFGTVTAISGSTITISSPLHMNGSTAATIFTVDASGASVTKNDKDSTLSDIKVGDRVLVEGTVNGTSVVAEEIVDNVPHFGGDLKFRLDTASDRLFNNVAGNGQPIIGGKITAISGNTISITTSTNIVYSVDASNAKVTQAGVNNATLSNLAIGDAVVVQGSVSGNAVVASSIIERSIPSAPNNLEENNSEHAGIFRAIGNFFSRLFGF